MWTISVKQVDNNSLRLGCINSGKKITVTCQNNSIRNLALGS